MNYGDKLNHLKPSYIAMPYIECLNINTIDVLKGFPVFFPNIPCPVKGKKINNGAKVVIAPKISPEKYDILIPT